MGIVSEARRAANRANAQKSTGPKTAAGKQAVRTALAEILPRRLAQALAAWLAQEEERDRLTREALSDVEAGRTIDHQSVQEWAMSLGTQQPNAVS